MKYLVPSLLFLCIFLLSISSFADTFMVSNPDDINQQGTLRWAINQANNDAGKDTISFSELPDATDIILQSTLPQITNPVVIDGTTYEDARLTIAGDTRLNTTNGFFLVNGSQGTIIKGLSIVAFANAAIKIDSTSNINISDNYIGTSTSGVNTSMTEYGIEVTSADSITIGGTYGEAGNLISNCQAAGIYFNNVSYSNIFGNRIGTNMNNNDTIPNETGIAIHGTSVYNSIGKINDPDYQNIISGNTGAGIFMENSNGLSATITNNTIAHNLIGVASDSTSELGNGTGISLGTNTRHNISKSNIIAYNNTGYIASDNNGVLNQYSTNTFFCNEDAVDLSAGSLSTPTAPVIANAEESHISGTANAGDTIEVFYADTTCNNAAGQVFIGSAIAGENGNWRIEGNFQKHKMTIASKINQNGYSSDFTNTHCIKESLSAGPDQFIYNDYTTLSITELKEDDDEENGIWRYTDSTGDVQFSDAQAKSTTVRNILSGNTYQFVWYNGDTTCPSYDTVNVTHLDQQAPDTPRLGEDTSVCGIPATNSIVIEGNHPPEETEGNWSVTDSNNPAEIENTDAFRNYKIRINNLQEGTNTLVYQWEDMGSDTINIFYSNGLEVYTENPSGCGSLRRAIAFANLNEDRDTITFDQSVTEIPVYPDTLLTDIRQPVLIDGFSHPDYQDHPEVSVLMQDSEQTEATALNIRAQNVSIRGLHFANFFRSVYVGADGANINHNYIGFDREGNEAAPFTGSGIRINGNETKVTNNKIGGARINNTTGSGGTGIFVNLRSQNLIRNNTLHNNETGVNINGGDGSAASNKISRNSFQCNGQGIRLTTNFRGGSIGNHDHDFPIITGISQNTVEGTAVPGDTVELYYRDTVCNKADGMIYFASVEADANGTWQYDGNMETSSVVALAFDSSGNTSEFGSSPCISRGLEAKITGSDFAKFIPYDSSGYWENIDKEGDLFEVDSSVAYHAGLSHGQHRLVWHGNLNNCPDASVYSDTITYFIDSTTNPDIDAGSDTVVCNVDSAQISGTGRFYQYDSTVQWIPLSSGLNVSNTDSTGISAWVNNLQTGKNYLIYRGKRYISNDQDSIIYEDLKMIYRNNMPLRVASDADSGCGTLRNAINFTNTNPGPDSISFAPIMAGKTISIESRLTINDDSLYINGDMNQDSTPDVAITSASNGTVFRVQGNAGHYLHLNIPAAGRAYSISGNDNRVQGNYLGTNMKGIDEESDVVNLNHGILLDTLAENNTIGGSTSAASNIITSCDSCLFIGSGLNTSIPADPKSNRITGNFIGIDKNRNIGVADGFAVMFMNTHGNQIGDGTGSGANHIAVNGVISIYLNSNNNEVNRNYIGGDLQTGDNFGNGGIAIGITGNNNQVSDNQVLNSGYNNNSGGVYIYEGQQNDVRTNTLAYNTRGILVENTASDNRFHQNSIYSNDSTGIYIDSTSQMNISPPTIQSLENNTLYGTAAPHAMVQVYADSLDQGQYFIDSLHADANGNWNLAIDKATIPQGLNTLTALQDSAGNTSAFSAPYLLIEATASGDTTVCDSLATITAAPPADGWTGTWEYLSDGNQNNIPDIADESDDTTQVSNLNEGENHFIWSLSNDSLIDLPDSENLQDTLTITYKRPTQASVADSVLISCDSISGITANQPAPDEIGQWSNLSGNANIIENNVAQTRVTGLETGLNTFVWQISDSLNHCRTHDTLTVRRAGLPQTQKDTSTVQAGDTTNIQVITNQEISTNNGIEVIEVINTNTLRESTYIQPHSIQYHARSDTSGTDLLTYQVCDSICTGLCITDTLIVNVLTVLPDIDAGKDTVACEPKAALSALEPETGWSGAWSASGNVNITDAGSPATTVTNLQEGSNQFIWTLTRDTNIVNPPQIHDTVTVKYFNPIAGILQESFTYCSADELVTLRADSIDSHEEGQWRALNPGISTLQEPNKLSTEIEGLDEDIRNTFVWEVSDTAGMCMSTDTIHIAYSGGGTQSYSKDTITVNDTLSLDVFYRKALLEGDTINIEYTRAPEKGQINFGPRNETFNYIPDPENLGNDTVEFVVNKNSCPADINTFIITIQNAPPQTQNTVDSSNYIIQVDVSDVNNNFDAGRNNAFSIISPGNYEDQGIALNISDTLITIDYRNFQSANEDSLEMQYRVCDAADSCTEVTLAVIAPESDEPSAAPPIEVYNAVSPNNDGVQDFLKIKNGDFYSRNGNLQVIIYNRWGTEVYRNNNYANKVAQAFKGISNDGKSLTDGTYYYHVTAEYAGEQKVKSGYLELKGD